MKFDFVGATYPPLWCPACDPYKCWTSFAWSAGPVLVAVFECSVGFRLDFHNENRSFTRENWSENQPHALTWMRISHEDWFWFVYIYIYILENRTSCRIEFISGFGFFFFLKKIWKKNFIIYILKSWTLSWIPFVLCFHLLVASKAIVEECDIESLFPMLLQYHYDHLHLLVEL